MKRRADCRVRRLLKFIMLYIRSVYTECVCTGYSGSDITNICRDASMMSMRRITAGLSLDDLKNLNKDKIKEPVRPDLILAICGCFRMQYSRVLRNYSRVLRN